MEATPFACVPTALNKWVLNSKGGTNIKFGLQYKFLIVTASYNLANIY